ncbi:MAG: HAD hydrolase family protein [Planctomycetes bacterium]|nr:HAD hydrolase family protein [Planctomycetota bacterium]
MPLNNIKLLLTDVDGVLTDGSINVHSDGSETKRFHVRDGAGIVAAQRVGLEVGILTGRPSVITTHRARELGITLIEQGSAMGKVPGYENLCRLAGVTDEQVAYIGDDLADLPVLVRVGYPMSVADAAEEVRGVAKFVTTRTGGQGALREAIEHILKSTGRWEQVLEQYGL